MSESGSEPDFDFDAEFAKAFGAEFGLPPADAAKAPSNPVPRAIVAVVVTPVASAPALAGLLAMSGVQASVIATSRGAIAARVIERDDEADAMAELLGNAPEVARAMAHTCSRTSKHGAILLVSRLGDGDEGLVGTIAASKWDAGEPAQEQVPAGLVLAQSDDVVEQILLGHVAPQDAPGAIEPGKLAPWQARRLFRKSQRRKRP